MENFLTINTFAWVVVIFFAGGWTFGLTKKQYNTRNTRMIVLWWWLCIGAIIFLKLSPFFLFALMPLAAFLSVVVPGLIGSIILAGSIFLINHFFLMKKLLAIVVLGLLFSGSANAEQISCRDIDTNEKFTVLYNSNEIKAFGKIFDDVFVSGNSILGGYYKYKKKLFGQKIDEYWKFNLSFDGLSMLTRGKYIDGEYEWLFQKYFSCS